MTYSDLLVRLLQLNAEQLKQDVRIYDSYEDEVSADGSAIEGFRTSNLILYLTCTTTRWVGRIITLYSRDGKPNADGDAGFGVDKTCIHALFTMPAKGRA